MAFIAQPYVASHDQELDLIELGLAPARCLKGENPNPLDSRGDDPDRRARLIAGRVHRGLEPVLVERRRRASRLRREALELDRIKELLRIS